MSKEVNPSSESGRFGPLEKTLIASLAGTAVLSVLGTVTANSPEDRGPQAVWAHSAHPNLPGTNTSSTFGVHDVIPGAPLPGVRVDAASIKNYMKQEDSTWHEVKTSHVEEMQDTSRIQKMVWARLFDKDPAARETADAGAEVDAAVDTVQELLAKGYTIDGITFHGFASDEDDTTWRTGKPGAGLGVDSEKNVRLAEKRADAVYDLFTKQLEAEGVTDTLPMEITGGTESRDTELNEAIAALAERRGESVQDVIVNWNRDRHDSFTKQELKVLNQLKDHRYVTIEVDAHRTVTEVSMVEKEGKWVTVTEEEDEGSLVIIPVIIPWIRRRKGAAGAKDHSSLRSVSVGGGVVHAGPRVVRGGNVYRDDMVRTGHAMPSAGTIGRAGTLYAARGVMAAGPGAARIPEATIPETTVTTVERSAPKPSARPPRDIGAVRPGYGAVAHRNKQPTFENNGTSRAQSNRKGRH